MRQREMSFLQPALLLGLPLALLPVLIHLINQHRHRTVQWAAMMFLLDARKLTKGLARLRQLLILAMRVLAVAALVFAASRPLSGGWVGLAGGRADTVLVLLDRSATMEQQHPETRESKRLAALDRLGGLLERTASGSEVLLIDSATLEITRLEDPRALASIPQTAPTATAADIPALLSRALDYLRTDASGRVDLWLASDLRHPSWDPSSDRWSAIRAELASRETARLALLAFADPPEDNLSVRVEGVRRRPAPEGLQLVMDLTVQRQGYRDGMPPLTIPVEFTLNGSRTVEEMTVDGPELVRLGYVLPLGEGNETGWGRIDLPADENLADNTAYFVYDEPPVRLTAILSDHAPTAEAIRAAATSATDPSLSFEAVHLRLDEAARIPWEEASLLFWHAPLPSPESNEAAFLSQFLDSGRSLVLLPPRESQVDDRDFLGVRWEAWRERDEAALDLGWWRSDSGLLAHTRSGAPLPVDELELFRVRSFAGEAQPLLRLEDGTAVLARGTVPTRGALYLWGTLPDASHSTLATDGIVFFVMLHRALEEGAAAVSSARERDTGPEAFASAASRAPRETPDRSLGRRALDTLASAESLTPPELLPGAFVLEGESGETSLLALNRPAAVDDPRVLSEDAVATLLDGVDYRFVSDSVNSGSSLASEIWRLFLVLMALALLVEAILSLPPAASERAPSFTPARPRTDP